MPYYDYAGSGGGGGGGTCANTDCEVFSLSRRGERCGGWTTLVFVELVKLRLSILPLLALLFAVFRGFGLDLRIIVQKEFFFKF
jgi:hypothetical protein